MPVVSPSTENRCRGPKRLAGWRSRLSTNWSPTPTLRVGIDELRANLATVFRDDMLDTHVNELAALLKVTRASTAPPLTTP
jgi:hypothetical protein